VPLRSCKVLLLMIAMCLGVVACAGYRGGWESLAYIGDPPPPAPPEDRTPFDADNRAVLNVSGLRLRVTINNQLQTYDAQVYLYALPLSVDPRRTYSQSLAPGKTRVNVHVTPLEAGFVFRPELAVLYVAGKQSGGTASFEFGRWGSQGNRVTQGGRWDHRPVGPELHLTEIGRQYLLSVDSATPVPSPESHDIAVDLSRALPAAEQPPLPLIRFLPIRWRESYS